MEPGFRRLPVSRIQHQHGVFSNRRSGAFTMGEGADDDSGRGFARDDRDSGGSRGEYFVDPQEGGLQRARSFSFAERRINPDTLEITADDSSLNERLNFVRAHTGVHQNFTRMLPQPGRFTAA